MITLQTPYVQFTELDGSPLDDGAVYIGTAGLNPQTNPITVYWDNAGTQPAAQPLSTRSGVIARNGAPARVYISASSYSLMVRDKRGRLVASELSITSSVDASGITDGTLAESKLDAALAAKINGALQTTGGTMTGAIVLPGNATNALEAVPKQQADSIAAAAVANRMQYVLTAAQAATSGTAVDFTGIATWAKRITIMMSHVSATTTGSIKARALVGGVEITTGYIGTYVFNGASASVGTFTDSLCLYDLTNGATNIHGATVLNLIGLNTWTCNGAVARHGGVAEFQQNAGSTVLAGAVDGIRVYCTAGTFDGGSVALLIEG